MAFSMPPFCHRDPGLVLLQHREDLFFRKPALLHLRLVSTESNSNRMRFRGNVIGRERAAESVR